MERKDQRKTYLGLGIGIHFMTISGSQPDGQSQGKEDKRREEEE